MFVRPVEVDYWPFIILADEDHPLWREDEAIEVDQHSMDLLRDRLVQNEENKAVISALIVDIIGADNPILARRTI